MATSCPTSFCGSFFGVKMPDMRMPGSARKSLSEYDISVTPMVPPMIRMKAEVLQSALR